MRCTFKFPLESPSFKSQGNQNGFKMVIITNFQQVIAAGGNISGKHGHNFCKNVVRKYPVGLRIEIGP